MKLILIASLAVLFSCAFQPYKSIYQADTAGINKCEPRIVQDWMVDFKSYEKPDFFEGYQKHTGYSKCSFMEKSDQVVVINCEQPMKYSHIVSWNMASCHKFMTDNKFQVVR